MYVSGYMDIGSMDVLKIKNRFAFDIRSSLIFYCYMNVDGCEMILFINLITHQIKVFHRGYSVISHNIHSRK